MALAVPTGSEPSIIMNNVVVPPDVLRKIFTHYIRQGDIPNTDEHNICSSKSSNADPEKLMQICGTWTTLAEETPTLWSSIFISSPNRHDLPIAKAWLKRAKTCPLSLCLFQSDVEDTSKGTVSKEDKSATAKLLRLFIGRSQNWKDVEFRLHFDATNPLLTTHLTTPPLLQRAVLDPKHDGEDTMLDEVWRVLHSSHSLREIHSFGSTWKKLGFQFSTDRAQLTRICIQSSLNVEELFDIFSSCANLLNLSIWNLFSKINQSPRSVITHLFLRTFLIHETKVDLSSIFDKLVLPSLKDLYMDHSLLDNSPSRGSIAFASLLARSRCSLKSLSLWDPKINGDQLLKILCFSSLSSLTKLSIRGVETIPDWIVGHLTRKLDNLSDEGSPELQVLPMLEELALGMCTIKTPTSTKLSEMVSSRLTPIRNLSTLRSLQLEVEGSSEEFEDRKALRRIHNKKEMETMTLSFE